MTSLTSNRAPLSLISDPFGHGIKRPYTTFIRYGPYTIRFHMTSAISSFKNLSSHSLWCWSLGGSNPIRTTKIRNYFSQVPCYNDEKASSSFKREVPLRVLAQALGWGRAKCENCWMVAGCLVVFVNWLKVPKYALGIFLNYILGVSESCLNVWHI